MEYIINTLILFIVAMIGLYFKTDKEIKERQRLRRLKFKKRTINHKNYIY